MPTVKRGQSSAKKRKPAGRGTASRGTASGGTMARAGAKADVLMQEIWARLVTAGAVGLTAIGLLSLFALFAGGYFVNMGDRLGALGEGAMKAAGFSVTRVTVKGAESLTEREVMQALWTEERGSVLGRSLFHIDASGAKAQLEALGPVRHAAVSKLWPDTVHVSVEERSAVALWQDGAGILHLVDADGVSLRPVPISAHTDLPVIVGTDRPAGAKEMIAALRRRPALFSSVAAVVSVGDRRFDLRFRNDFTAKLPQEGIDEALLRLEGLGAGTGKLSASLDYIDLRDPKWAYYKPKEE